MKTQTKSKVIRKFSFGQEINQIQIPFELKAFNTPSIEYKNDEQSQNELVRIIQREIKSNQIIILAEYGKAENDEKNFYKKLKALTEYLSSQCLVLIVNPITEVKPNTNTKNELETAERETAERKKILEAFSYIFIPGEQDSKKASKFNNIKEVIFLSNLFQRKEKTVNLVTVLNEKNDSIDVHLRSIIVVGKTGVGKSKFLNELLGGEFVFKSSADTKSCTDKVQNHLKIVNFKPARHHAQEAQTSQPETETISIGLKVFDTPGIADSEGRSKKFLNKIARTIKDEPLNLLIIVIEYGKFDTFMYSNLEVLRECLNGLAQSSSMLLINKVPTEKKLQKSRSKGEECRDRQEVINEINDKVSKALEISFKYKFFLEDDDLDGAEDFNIKQYDLIRQVIVSRSLPLDATKVRTWDDIKNLYDRDIMKLSNEEINDQIKEEISDLKNKLDKVEWDIADIIYPFLVFNNKLVSVLVVEDSTIDFVSNFDCKVTKEQYFEKSGENNWTKSHLIKGFGIGLAMSAVSVVSFFLMPLTAGLSVLIGGALNGGIGLYAFYKSRDYFQNSMVDNLKNLVKSRINLNEKLENSHGSIEHMRKMLKEKQKNLWRLENALENPNQKKA